MELPRAGALGRNWGELPAAGQAECPLLSHSVTTNWWDLDSFHRCKIPTSLARVPKRDAGQKIVRWHCLAIETSRRWSLKVPYTHNRYTHTHRLYPPALLYVGDAGVRLWLSLSLGSATF